jgi:dTDP-4-amino-4,6-dideoxygalactose transaminase
VFPVRTSDRDGLRASLAQAGVDTGIHYSPGCHRQPPFGGGHDPDRLRVADAWAAEELSLPMFEHLTERELERVAAACSEALAAPRAAAATGVPGVAKPAKPGLQ